MLFYITPTRRQQKLLYKEQQVLKVLLPILIQIDFVFLFYFIFKKLEFLRNSVTIIDYCFGNNILWEEYLLTFSQDIIISDVISWTLLVPDFNSVWNMF